MVDLSKYLNRTMVQPCVRNGCLEPCRCGAQKDVDVWDLSGYERGEDPMNLPYINYPCEPYTGDARSYVGWSYNLEVYIDVSALKAYWPHIITYDEWCEGVMKKDPEAKTEPEHNRWLIPKAYCGELHYAWCGPPPITIGDFRITGHVDGRKPSLPTTLADMKADPQHTIMIYGYYRHYYSTRAFPLVPFNRGHYIAAEAFKQKYFGSAPMTAFHWRSEHVDEDILLPCAESIIAVMNRVEWPKTPSGYRGLLLSDMPAPGGQIMWHTYVGSNNKGRNGAMSTVMAGGFVKYDYFFNTVGVRGGGVG